MLLNCAQSAFITCITKLLIIMEVTFYQFGVEYLRWKDKNGHIWEAVKEQVEFLGKEVFECDIEDFKEEHHCNASFNFPDMTWTPITDEEWNEIINL